MNPIDELNSTWESHLVDLNAQIWENMKAIGVTASWVDPMVGRESMMFESPSGSNRQIQANELYEFVVQHQGNILVKRIKRTVSVHDVVVGAVISAMRQLEQEGYTLLPPLDSGASVPDTF
jgi:hypothetical protein